MKRAVCNEMFGGMELERSCALLADHGYSGIEIAPFTVAGEEGRIGSGTTVRIRRTLADSGLKFAGFHWLLAAPPGLHITSSYSTVRERTIDHLRHLTAVSGELGGGSLVFGSPKQRTARDIPAAEARRYLADGFRKLASDVEAAGSVLCIEALSSADTNLINTLAEARALVEEISSPSVQTMFDFHNCTDEQASWEELAGRYGDIVCHIHLNSWSGGYPPVEDAPDYAPALRTFFAGGYDGWVSLEIFSVPDDPALVAAETARFLDAAEQNFG